MLKLAFFFDGTGNNLDADEDKDAHSNAARLYKAHPESDSANGQCRFYVPGLGTYFRQINDSGDDDGLAVGTYGDARLDKAMQWLKETVAKHPADKVVEIKLSVFGFSRGARWRAPSHGVSTPRVTGLQLWPGLSKPCSIYFMGLFDTVASVGTPASTSTLAFWIAKKWEPLDKLLDSAQREAFFSLGQAWLRLDRAASMTEIALAPASEVDGVARSVETCSE